MVNNGLEDYAAEEFEKRMTPATKAALFEQIVLPHVEAGWNLARWMTHDAHDAEDVIQEASLRALRFMNTFRGEDGRSWFLAIVRNLCHGLHRQSRGRDKTVPLDDQIEVLEPTTLPPLEKMEKASDIHQLRQAIERLPLEYREALMLREFEGLSYKQIASVAGIPMGTVMSRLARGREKLVELMTAAADQQEGTP